MISVVTETAVDTAVDEPVGRVIIRWPKPRLGVPLIGWATQVIDIDTGQPITTATCGEVRVIFDPTEIVTAELTMFADADGKPIFDGMPVLDTETGELRTATFRFQVMGMETR